MTCFFLPFSLTPAVKVEKIHLKMDYSSSSKLAHVPTSSSSSSSASTVSSSPSKPGLTSPSVPKAQLLAPGHIPNGKGHLTSLDKKQDSSTNASSRRLYRKQPGEGRKGGDKLFLYIRVYPVVGIDGAEIASQDDDSVDRLYIFI